jgi:hypothetical protein
MPSFVYAECPVFYTVILGFIMVNIVMLIIMAPPPRLPAVNLLEEIS